MTNATLRPRLKATVMAMAGALSGVLLTACSGAEEATTAVYHCGAQPVQIETHDEQVTLTLGDDQYQLNQVEAASGARYSNQDADHTVVFWSKGERAQLEVGSRAYSECTRPGAIIEPHIARGNEPFWLIEINQGEAVLRNMGEDEQNFSVVSQEWREDGSTEVVAELKDSDEQLTYQVHETLCEDSMSGMSYPQTAELQVDGQRLQGCAGIPQRLLEGVDWQVAAIDDESMDDYEIFVRFAADGSVAGRAACNRYFGQYELTGEGLQFGELAGTKMACEDDKMRAEYRFLGVLSEVQRFSIEREDGATDVLWLDTGDERIRLSH
ncbi:hypothetical protein CWE12_08760 [Aliidiomarina sedimenti]|uniref:Secreted protein containing HslJ-like protein n=1 Tax=Aliidiomarina sedimenti TaxID=1933879 RepID=A0ABY0BZ52_9GAMM|nr:META domain-containing protein [Aliidiomarina sedimenti]RUO30039.1 hypothetical protein CWE12_08760 [Aliidiomarina sedimenti]